MKKICQRVQQDTLKTDHIDFTGKTKVILTFEVPFLPPQTLHNPEKAISGSRSLGNACLRKQEKSLSHQNFIELGKQRDCNHIFTLFSKRSAHENHPNFLRSLGHWPWPRVILILSITPKTIWQTWHDPGSGSKSMCTSFGLECTLHFWESREKTMGRLLKAERKRSYTATSMDLLLTSLIVGLIVGNQRWYHKLLRNQRSHYMHHTDFYTMHTKQLRVSKESLFYHALDKHNLQTSPQTTNLSTDAAAKLGRRFFLSIFLWYILKVSLCNRRCGLFFLIIMPKKSTKPIRK